MCIYLYIRVNIYVYKIGLFSCRNTSVLTHYGGVTFLLNLALDAQEHSKEPEIQKSSADSVASESNLQSLKPLAMAVA